MRRLYLVSLLLGVSPTAVLAQEAAVPAPVEDATPDEEAMPDDLDEYPDDIVVIAESFRGQVITAQPPILTLDEEEIASYGASSIAELLDSLSAQTGSGRGRGSGRPVILLNGQRISSFREMRSIPPEAIKRLEILPEEVALQFGYAPDLRVVNFILKDNFSSEQAAGEYNVPTRGGTDNYELEAGLFKIAGPSRINLETKIVETSLLTEAERNIVQENPAAPGEPDPADYRSLVAADREITLNGTLTRGIGDGGLGGSITANAAYTRNDTRSLSGLDPVLFDPLERRTASDAFEAGLALNKALGGWQFTATANGGYTESTTEVDRRSDAGDDSGADPGFDTARTKDISVGSLATLVGRPFRLPGGEAALTVKAGFDYDRSRNTDTRNDFGATILDRSDFSTGVNLSLPVTSRREGFLDAVGDVSLNFSGGLNRLSDFGTLTNWSSGLTWRPTERLSLQASYIAEEAAPSLSQLGAPEVVTLNVPVYDFSRGENVLITTTSGGNPDLVSEKRRDIKLSANWELPFLDRSNLIVEYFRNRSTDVTQAFPLLTPAVEAAFPGRVTRDAAGNLVAIDRRAVTFDKIESSSMRWGFNISGKLGSEGDASGPGGDRRGGGGFQGGFARDRSAPPAPAQTTTPEGGEATTRPALDPARWAAFRIQFCGPEGGPVPDPSTYPEDVQQRLRGADGEIDQERLKRMRERICSAEGAEPPRRFDPERFQQMRTTLCEDGTPDPDALPERMRERLLGADGKVDPARLNAARERICSNEGGPPRGDPQRGGPPGEGGRSASGGSEGGGGGPPMPFGRGGPPGGRWNLSVYHTWKFSDEVTIASGGPVLDQLAGDALSAGGVPRHQIEIEGGLFKDGYGLRMNGTWSAPATVKANGAPGTSDLRFGSTFTIDLRAFVNLDQQTSLIEKAPWLKGTRVSFTVDNILDSRQKVTDESGFTPLAYQRAYRDPRGRVVGIDIRKLF
ncbi:hypothetical protein B2G71_15595 [Novosphingobium sp. PC22D]|uniref:TonB-dependent receptor plug domain-containing protein n=1 Tax=Novosphingobium sp. PC22D TaxID=1962403 RepID=UPI000BFAB246|nr:TonB-dependent receptor [Novosphingobium sp. PC22D]PEQ11856.1 hypothetical protein B2G71_15595 [Novosphingobium sp. PC22D]